VAPSEHAAAKLLRERAVLHQKRKHRVPKALGEKCLRHSGQRDKAPIGKEGPVRGEHVHMRVEVDQVTESLNEEDQPGPRTGQGFGMRALKQPRSNAAQLAQPLAAPGEEKSDGVLREGAGVNYAWIERHKWYWLVSVQCEVLGVSPSGYHQHFSRRASPAAAKAGEQ